MVPNTSDDFPDPETPVNTVICRFGMSSETFLRFVHACVADLDVVVHLCEALFPHDGYAPAVAPVTISATRPKVVKSPAVTRFLVTATAVPVAVSA
jgi:hypothetical protein